VGSVLAYKKEDVAPMLMVRIDSAAVERQLVSSELACPLCDAELRPWGFVRSRRLRQADGSKTRQRLRRSRCRGCRVTHVLLPVLALRRRLDVAETIVRALLAHALGMGQRRVAAGVGRPEDTVRGWLRRARQRAPQIRDHFTLLGHERFGCDLRLEPQSTPLEDALNVMGVVVAAAVQQIGPGPLWHFVAGATGGVLLCNTSHPFPRAYTGAHAAANAVTFITTAAHTEGDAAHERSPP
jgi:hypothetical protein